MIRHEGYRKEPYKTCRDRKQTTVIPKIEGYITSKWQARDFDFKFGAHFTTVSFIAEKADREGKSSTQLLIKTIGSYMYVAFLKFPCIYSIFCLYYMGEIEAQ